MSRPWRELGTLFFGQRIRNHVGDLHARYGATLKSNFVKESSDEAVLLVALLKEIKGNLLSL